jgi:hypothetical protein
MKKIISTALLSLYMLWYVPPVQAQVFAKRFTGGNLTVRTTFPSGTTLLPSIGFVTFSGGPGINYAGSGIIKFVEGSTYAYFHTSSGLVLGSSTSLQWGNTSDLDSVSAFEYRISRTNTQGGQVKALTAAAATAFVEIGVAAGASVSGFVDYEIYAADAADHQSRSGTLYFSAVNKAGVETCTVFRAQGSTVVDNTTDAAAVSAGTLTNTFTCTTASADAITLNANAVSSLVETTLRITYRPTITSGINYTVTPQ